MTSIWQNIPTSFTYPTDKPILENTFRKPSKKVRTLKAYPTYILMFKQGEVKAKYMMKYEFEFKFEVEEEKEVLNFLWQEDIEDPQVYELFADPQVVQQWKKFLKGRMNQWRFHEYFEVQKRIGKGSFASVYMAQRKEDGQMMAIKAFSKSAAFDEENGKAAIINEINLMRKLAHPNLLRLYQVYETQNSLYLAMDLLEGGSLHEILKHSTVLTTKQIQTILVCLLSGLEYMHSKDIMHRDLKMENILFKDKNLESLVIGDFGLATYVHEKVYLYCRCGTPGYVAPEVINIKDLNTTYSSVCDIYSVGLIFYLLITNKHAFNAKSYNQLVKQNRVAMIDYTLKQFDYTPKDALDLLKKMLEKDPKKRINAESCLKHPYLKDIKIKVKSETEIEIDYIDETADVNDTLADKMSQINQETAKFDMMKKHSLLNSPIQSPALFATNRIRPHDMSAVDSENKMQMRSPVMNGRLSSVDSKYLYIKTLQESPKDFTQGSPLPSKFMTSSIQGSPTNQQRKANENALLKYTLKKNSLQQQQLQQQQTQEKVGVKNVKSNLSKQI